MLKYILVAAPGSVADEAVFATALAAAAPVAAHLVFLHVRVDITEMAVAMTSGGGTAVQSVLDIQYRMRDGTHYQDVCPMCRRKNLALTQDALWRTPEAEFQRFERF